MFRFFRTLRQRLLTENRVSRYLLYAVGEIMLVVVGILIALQIDTWNEESKVEKSIASHLAILKQNLLEDQAQLRELQQNMAANRRYADSALLQMRTQIPMDKALKKYLVILLLEYEFRPNRNAFETITQSNEIPFLAEDMQTAVLNYYALIERTNEREHISNTQIQSKYEPYINVHYPETFQRDNPWEFIQKEYRNDPRPVRSIAPEKYLADGTLETLLVARYYQTTQLERFYGELLGASGVILGLIEQSSDPQEL